MIFILLLACTRTYAGPAGSDLLEACEISIANGFKNLEGQMCEYYITPCNCDSDTIAVTGVICLPEQISTGVLARVVIDGLKSSPNLLQEHAGNAAEIILAQRFPCPQ